MKVLLLKDVYKLGRAGEVKKVAAGYARNYLIPQRLAVPATEGALKQSERIKTEADKERAILNQEMEGIAEILKGQRLTFGVRASETGRLYGSVSARHIAERIQEAFEVELNNTQIDHQPIRELGQYAVPIRLTIDLVPEVDVVVHREGEPPESVLEEEEVETEAEETQETAEEMVEFEPPASEAEETEEEQEEQEEEEEEEAPQPELA